ncbi:unnamed protein product [Haemonchus placei]|uniref:Uncharacterized protein n=1 Tax=Haemonchus placei TaxID=6290 RepID=A0A0N4XBY9_HAEPC|nr:unnamed protein product [Haemonchus placei]
MCSLPGSSSSEGTQGSIHKWYFTKEEVCFSSSLLLPFFFFVILI